MSFFKSSSALLVTMALVAAASTGCSASQDSDGPSEALESNYTRGVCVSKPATFAFRCPVTGTNGWSGEVRASKFETVQGSNHSASCKSKGVSSHIELMIEKSTSGRDNGTVFFGTGDPVDFDIETLATTPITMSNLTSVDAGIVEDDGTLHLDTDANGAIRATVDFRGHQAFFGGGEDTTKGAFEVKGQFACQVVVAPNAAP